ncbi:interferon alpha-inducible protein 27, mitochondrial-like [Haemaphysalis longicornis]
MLVMSLVSVVGATAAIVGPRVVLKLLGFGPAGVEAGSWASKLQGAAVGKKSYFAKCQSWGTKGFSGDTKVVLGTVGAEVASIITMFMLYRASLL